jgi:hypothetical protein
MGVRSVIATLLPRGTFQPAFHMQCQHALLPVRDALPHDKGYPAMFGGTDEQRLDVPTEHGVPSIDIPLYVQGSDGRCTVQSGTMKFLYGYVIAATGTRHNGWMAYDALEVSSGCP